MGESFPSIKDLPLVSIWKKIVATLEIMRTTTKTVMLWLIFTESKYSVRNVPNAAPTLLNPLCAPVADDLSWN